MRRKTLIKTGALCTLVGIALLVTGVLSGCGAKHLAEKAACAVKIAGWYKHDHGKGDLNAVKDAAQAALKAGEQVQNDHSKAVVDAAQAKVVTLRSAITALNGNLPPDCAGGVNDSIHAALRDYNQAAGSEADLIKAVQKDDAKGVQAAAKDMQGHAHDGNEQARAALKAALHYAES